MADLFGRAPAGTTVNTSPPFRSACLSSNSHVSYGVVQVLQNNPLCVASKSSQLELPNWFLVVMCTSCALCACGCDARRLLCTISRNWKGELCFLFHHGPGWQQLWLLNIDRYLLKARYCYHPALFNPLGLSVRLAAVPVNFSKLCVVLLIYFLFFSKICRTGKKTLTSCRRFRGR